MPTVLITGAGRGLGLEFARQYAAEGWEVIATVREAAPELDEVGVRVERLDMRDFAALETFPERLGGAPLDLFIANAGITAAKHIDSAEEAGTALEVLAVNAVAPTLLARRLAPLVEAAGGKMAAITSHMGSIADTSGGWLGYRGSKAALNAYWASLAHELPVPIVLLHPGWVQTDMGGPSAPLPPSESIAGMRRVIDALTKRQSGAFLDYQGNTVPW